MRALQQPFLVQSPMTIGETNINSTFNPSGALTDGGIGSLTHSNVSNNSASAMNMRSSYTNSMGVNANTILDQSTDNSDNTKSTPEGAHTMNPF